MPRYLILVQLTSAEKTPREGRFPISELAFGAAALLAVLSWLIPLHVLPWVSWHSEVLAFLAAFLLAWVMLFRLVRCDGSRTVKLPFLAVPFVLFALLALMQGANGLIAFWGDALVFVFYMALCVICLVLGFAFSRTEPTSGAAVDAGGNRALTYIAIALLVGAFASVVVAFAQIFELWESSIWINRMFHLRRPGGNLGQPNQLATLLLMGLGSVFFLYESGKLKALSSVLILLVLCIGLAITESRAGVLSFLALVAWWFLKNKRVGFRLSPWVVVLTATGFLSFFWLWPSLFAYVQQITGGDAEVNIKAGSRLVVWPQLLEALAQRPWFGWGLGEVSKAHNAVADAYSISEPFSYSHNIFLDLGLGIGLPLAAFIAVLALVWSCRRAKAVNCLEPWYCLAIVLPFAVHSMLEFPFAYAYFLVPVMLVLGVLEGAAVTRSATHIGLRPAAALLLCMSALVAWSLVEYVEIEEDFRVVRFESLQMGQTPSDYRRPQIVLLTQLGALLDAARIAPRPNMSGDELERLRKVALRYPWMATQNRYALSLALNGSPLEAVRQLRVLRAMYGEQAYLTFKASWNSLAQDKYPQLRELHLP